MLAAIFLVAHAAIQQPRLALELVHVKAGPVGNHTTFFTNMRQFRVEVTGGVERVRSDVRLPAWRHLWRHRKRRNLFAVTLTNLANLYVPRAARNGLLQGIRRWMVKRQIELAGPLTLFIAGLVRIKGVG
jgi:hypothetical protein